jgi:hypothetical protein
MSWLYTSDKMTVEYEIIHKHKIIQSISGVPRNFFSTNAVEDRRQSERGSGGGGPLVRGSTQFANECNPYSD